MSGEIIRQLGSHPLMADFDELNAWVMATTEKELDLVNNLPLSHGNLVKYLQEEPERSNVVIERILDRCRDELARNEGPENLQSVPHLQVLVNTISTIQNLVQKVATLELEAYLESTAHHMHSLTIDEVFREIREARRVRTSHQISPAEESALWQIANAFHSPHELQELRKKVAIDVVIWKMLRAWLEAMNNDDPCSSETDLFGANQLQLIRGSSGKMIGRSAIARRITTATESYSGTSLNNFDIVVRQTLVEELFPKVVTPLFWFENQPFAILRENRRVRKNRIHRPIREVEEWQCDVCANCVPPGYQNEDLVPWKFGPDKRIKSRKEVSLIDSLPDRAFAESRFMCTCWIDHGGLLCPQFKNLTCPVS